MSRKEIVNAAAALLVERLLGMAVNDTELRVDVDSEGLRLTEADLHVPIVMPEARPMDTHSGKDPVRVVCGTTPITIRIPNRVLQAFRAQSEKTGTKYQTLINRALSDAADTFKKSPL